MNYLKSHVRHFRDYTDRNEEKLSVKTIDALWYMTEHGIDSSDTDTKTIKDSRNNGSNFWFELGETNPEYRNNGGFETIESDQDQ